MKIFESIFKSKLNSKPYRNGLSNTSTLDENACTTLEKNIEFLLF